MGPRLTKSTGVRLLFGISVGVGIVFFITSGIARDPQVTQLLKGPSAIETFLRTRRHFQFNQETNAKLKPSPLVQEAKRFALLLNPPSPPEELPRAKPVGIRPSLPVKPRNPSPTFKLHATIYHRSRPEESMALICELGNNLKWVKQDDKVGYFTIEEIQSGRIVLRHGEKSEEMMTEHKEKPKRFVRSIQKSYKDMESAAMTVGMAEIDTGVPLLNPEGTRPNVNRQNNLAQPSRSSKKQLIRIPLKNNTEGL